MPIKERVETACEDLLIQRGKGMDAEIYRAAFMAIEQYGERALSVATEVADCTMVSGHFDSHRTWLDIADAIKNIESLDCFN